MSTPESDSSSSYGVREADANATSRLSMKKTLFAIIVLIIVMGSPWWLTVIPQFSFTN